MPVDSSALRRDRSATVAKMARAPDTEGPIATLSPSVRQRLAAGAVHLLTTSGGVWAVVAIDAIVDERWRTAFIFMSLGLFIDAVDGTLARRARVAQVFPGFDGALLDNLVDFLSYVIVPSVLLYHHDLLPPGFALLAITAICMSSGYQFCQRDAKTGDHYFTGFPSYWNILAFYLFFLELDPWSNLAWVLACSLAVFVPIKYIYPSRTRRHRKLTLFLGAAWALLVIVTILRYPDSKQMAAWSLLYLGYYFGMSLWHLRPVPAIADP